MSQDAESATYPTPTRANPTRLPYSPKNAGEIEVPFARIAQDRVEWQNVLAFIRGLHGFKVPEKHKVNHA